MSSSVSILRVAGALGALAVMLGAFGAHGLKERLSPEMLVIYQTGVQYHFYHALALLALGCGPDRLLSGICGKLAAWGWIGGIAIFSGSLYLLAVTGIKWLGAITPFGGVAFIVGWICLAVAAGKKAA